MNKDEYNSKEGQASSGHRMDGAASPTGALSPLFLAGCGLTGRSGIAVSDARLQVMLMAWMVLADDRAVEDVIGWIGDEASDCDCISESDAWMRRVLQEATERAQESPNRAESCSSLMRRMFAADGAWHLRMSRALNHASEEGLTIVDLRRALQQLPVIERAALLLHDGLGWQLDRVARAINLEHSQAIAHVHTARLRCAMISATGEQQSANSTR